MKTNKLLALSLIACSLLTSCDKDTTLKDNKDAGVGNIVIDNGTADQTFLTLQKFYDTQKESNGGNVAMKAVLAKIYEAEYGWVANDFSSETAPVFKFAVREDAPLVNKYHTADSFKADINEKFQDILDKYSYTDDNGEFDPELYKDYMIDTLKYEKSSIKKLSEKASIYFSDEIASKFVYNYDEYIEDNIIPTILEGYIYFDALTASSKYKSQFASQYAVKLEVLKLPYNTTKENGSFYDSLVTDVKAITNKTIDKFHTGYSFATFDSNNDLIIFTTEETGLTYTRYTKADAATSNPCEALLNSMLTPAAGKVSQITAEAAKAEVTGANAANYKKVEELKITKDSTTNEEFYKTVEKILIARDLYKIDSDMVLAKNYDYKTAKYNSMSETEKSKASDLASTYSSSNTKPFLDVAKEKKISAQQVKYYTEPDYYNKSTYTNVLPSALSSLRGYNAKDLISNLRTYSTGGTSTKGGVSGGDDQFLLPTNDSLTDPVYLDVNGGYYYVCEVSDWYGYYLTDDVTNPTTSTYGKNGQSYQISAYQAGEYVTYSIVEENGKKTTKENAAVAFNAADPKWQSIIEMVKVSAENILTSSMKKEAMVALFNSYELTIRDQDVHDYIKSQYPDYFDEEDSDDDK